MSGHLDHNLYAQAEELDDRQDEHATFVELSKNWHLKERDNEGVWVYIGSHLRVMIPWDQAVALAHALLAEHEIQMTYGKTGDHE